MLLTAQRPDAGAMILMRVQAMYIAGGDGRKPSMTITGLLADRSRIARFQISRNLSLRRGRFQERRYRTHFLF